MAPGGREGQLGPDLGSKELAQSETAVGMVPQFCKKKTRSADVFGLELEDNGMLAMTTFKLHHSIGLFPLVCAGVFASLATGAPVTMRFEAMISTVAPGIPYESGLDFSVGDRVFGEFTFDPLEGGKDLPLEAVQPYRAKLIIDGHAFVTPEQIDNLMLRSFNARTDLPPSPLDVEGFDVILGGSSLKPAVPLDLPIVSLSRSSFSFRIEGDASIIDVASFPQDAETWNKFDLSHKLSVAIRGHEAGVVGFSAVISHFTVVPEPAQYGMTVVAMLAGICGWRVMSTSKCT